MRFWLDRTARVIQEVCIPDDGRKRGSKGKVQTARLQAHVDRIGVYALNITVSNDRYGQNMVWGLRTNCARFVIETARGHKDERHQEPVVLCSPEQPADVCFYPRKQAFSYAVSGLATDSHEIKLFDALGKLLHATSVGKDGTAMARCRPPFRVSISLGACIWRRDRERSTLMGSRDGNVATCVPIPAAGHQVWMRGFHSWHTGGC